MPHAYLLTAQFCSRSIKHWLDLASVMRHQMMESVSR